MKMVKVSNKLAYTILAIGVIISIAIIINAYGGNQPNVVGHTFGELNGVQAIISQGLTKCLGDNLSIKTINPDTGAVECEVDDSRNLDISPIYSASNGASTKMYYQACFLTNEKQPIVGDFAFDCKITGYVGNWTLVSSMGSGGAVDCKAVCINTIGNTMTCPAARNIVEVLCSPGVVCTLIAESPNGAPNCVKNFGPPSTFRKLGYRTVVCYQVDNDQEITYLTTCTDSAGNSCSGQTNVLYDVNPTIC